MIAQVISIQLRLLRHEETTFTYSGVFRISERGATLPFVPSLPFPFLLPLPFASSPPYFSPSLPHPFLSPSPSLPLPFPLPFSPPLSPSPSLPSLRSRPP